MTSAHAQSDSRVNTRRFRLTTPYSSGRTPSDVAGWEHLAVILEEFEVPFSRFRPGLWAIQAIQAVPLSLLLPYPLARRERRL